MKNSPVPQVLLDQTDDIGLVPCWRCPDFVQHTATRVHEWDYGHCKKGWLPRDFTLAALDEGNTGSKFGSAVRKLARLCPHRARCNSYLAYIYIFSQEDLNTVWGRVQIMCETLPGASTVIPAVVKVL